VFRLFIDNTNLIDFLHVDGILRARHRVGGGYVTLQTTTYDAAAHRWWQLREADGTVYWETSPDGTTWSTFYSEPAPIAVTALFGYLQAGGAGTSADVARFDNWNTPPVSVAPQTPEPDGITIDPRVGTPRLARHVTDATGTILPSLRLAGPARVMAAESMGAASLRARLTGGDRLAAAPARGATRLASVLAGVDALGARAPVGTVLARAVLAGATTQIAVETIGHVPVAAVLGGTERRSGEIDERAGRMRLSMVLAGADRLAAIAPGRARLPMALAGTDRLTAIAPGALRLPIRLDGASRLTAVEPAGSLRV